MARHGGRSAGPRQSCCHAHLKELLEAGFVGEVMAVHVSLLRDGVLRRPSHRTWQRDAELGADTLTIANGHTVDAMRFVTGDFSRLSAVVATQAKQWLDTGTNTLLDHHQCAVLDQECREGARSRDATARAITVLSATWAGVATTAWRGRQRYREPGVAKGESRLGCWNSRSLAEEPIVRLILDATVVRVGLDRQATSIALLVVLGVRQDGQKVLLAVNNMGGETSQAWRAVLDDRVERERRQPEFPIVAQPMEERSHRQRDAPRGVQAPDQNSDGAAIGRDCSDVVLATARLRSDHDAQSGRMAQPDPQTRR